MKPIYKVVIVEDSVDNAAALRQIIQANHPDITIVAEANTVETAYNALVTHKPDMALMDIELTPGTSFDVLAKLNKDDHLDFEIIFISAHPRYDYATKAIDFSSLAFLTKPIDPEILRGAIEKAKAKQTKKIQIEQLLSKLQVLSERDAHIVIPSTNNNKVVVNVADITYIKADGQTSIVHFNDGTSLVAFCILGHFKKMLNEEDVHHFFLIHNSLFINVSQVKSFKYLSLEVAFKNGEKLKASRRFGKDFKKHWEEFSNQKSGFWGQLRNLFR